MALEGKAHPDTTAVTLPALQTPFELLTYVTPWPLFSSLKFPSASLRTFTKCCFLSLESCILLPILRFQAPAIRTPHERTWVVLENIALKACKTETKILVSQDMATVEGIKAET